MAKTILKNLENMGMLAFAEEPADGNTGWAGSDTAAGDTDGDRGDGDGDTEGDEDDDDDSERAGGKRALLRDLARERSRRKSLEAENADFKEKFQAIEDKDKTELQKAVERAEKAEKALHQLQEAERVSELRRSVVAKKNLPSEWAELVTGDTEDEMNAVADRILANLGNGGGDKWPTLHGTRGQQVGSMEAGREAAKNFQ